jgi:hypothetical protein
MIDMTNLWPAEITEVSEITPPVVILDQQAAMLGNMTKNIILAEIKSEKEAIFVLETDDFLYKYEFSYAFYIVAPILDNYRYNLLTIWHNIDLYPVVVNVEENIYKEIYKDFDDKITFSPWALRVQYEGKNQVEDSFMANSKKEFLDILKAIFGASKTKRIISALLAQSNPESKAS